MSAGGWLRQRRLAATGLGLAAVALVTGCGSTPQPVAASVGAITVPESALRQELAALQTDPTFLSRLQVNGRVSGDGFDGFSPTFVASVLTQEIDSAATTALMSRLHVVPLSEPVAASVAAATFQQTYGDESLASFPTSYQKSLIARTADDIALDAALAHVDVSVAGLTKYRNAHPQLFDVICLSGILSPTRAKAILVRRQLTHGGRFSTVARRESLDPSAAHGGSLGCGAAGQFDRAFAEISVSASPNHASLPVRDPEGWWVLDVTSRTQRSVVAAAPDIISDLIPDDSLASAAVAKYLGGAQVRVSSHFGTFDRAVSPPRVVAAAT